MERSLENLYGPSHLKEIAKYLSHSEHVIITDIENSSFLRSGQL